MFPLFDRFPALASVPRAVLGEFPSPVERIAVLEGEQPPAELWLKRDDLNAPILGGNKVRSLEFLLGGVRPGDTILTVGGEGSTHVLATAVHAARLGARTVAVRWPHDMNPAAEAVAARARALCAETKNSPFAVTALARALGIRLTRRVRYIPVGGTIPLGILGHVNAGLELAEQVAHGELAAPGRVVVALGSGGTAAGLALGFAIAELDTVVVAARVVPRIVANKPRIRTLIRRTARLIERTTGERPPGVDASRVEVVHTVFGGAYGRPLPAGERLAARLHDSTDARLDSTYGAKALAAALDVARASARPTLFWVTFDGRGVRREG